MNPSISCFVPFESLMLGVSLYYCRDFSLLSGIAAAFHSRGRIS